MQLSNIAVLLSVYWLGDDRRPSLEKLSIATFNARFLFDGRAPEGEASFPWKNNPAAARAHVRDIAAILRPVDADIIHISEVENVETLRRLILELGDPTYRAYLVPGRDAFTGQNVGLLTRIDPDAPLVRTDEWAVGPAGGAPQGVPKNYAARITVGDLALTIIGAHLLAFPDDPERWPRREAQAEALRRLAEDEGTRKGRLTIVVGDLNDLDPEIPDASGRISSSHVLRILSQAAAWTQEDELWNPAALLLAEERFTAFADFNRNGLDDGLSERSLTDHVLLPRAFEACVESVRVYPDHDPFGPSDHFPLKVTLDLSARSFFRRGDVNDDRRIDDGDAMAIARHLFAGAPLACEDAADTDDDGRPGVTDVIALLLHIHQGGPGPAPPGPALPGLDPSLDALDCR